MVRQGEAVDIDEMGANPNAWRSLLEEVVRTKERRILQADGKDIAILIPINKSRQQRAKLPKRAVDDAIFWSAAGGWKGIVDAERLKRELAEARGSDRPTVAL